MSSKEERDEEEQAVEEEQTVEEADEEEKENEEKETWIRRTKAVKKRQQELFKRKRKKEKEKKGNQKDKAVKVTTWPTLLAVHVLQTAAATAPAALMEAMLKPARNHVDSTAEEPTNSKGGIPLSRLPKVSLAMEKGKKKKDATTEPTLTDDDRKTAVKPTRTLAGEGKGTESVPVELPETSTKQRKKKVKRKLLNEESRQRRRLADEVTDRNKGM